MTDRTPALPGRTVSGLPPAPVSPTVEAPVDGADVRALLSAFRVLQTQHARVLRQESATRDLNPTDTRLVFFLAATDGLSATPKQAGDHLGLSTGAMTSLIDRLERRGHLERRPNPLDRRSILLHLTPSGAAIADEIGGVYATAFREAVGPAESGPLTAALGRLGDALGRHDTVPGAPVDATRP